MDFVLAVLASKPSHKVIEVLAAGPLEDLLGYQGPNIIDRVEDEARRSPEFRHLLGGVRKSGFMTDDVWQRMIKVAPERWW